MLHSKQRVRAPACRARRVHQLARTVLTARAAGTPASQSSRSARPALPGGSALPWAGPRLRPVSRALWAHSRTGRGSPRATYAPSARTVPCQTPRSALLVRLGASWGALGCLHANAARRAHIEPASPPRLPPAATTARQDFSATSTARACAPCANQARSSLLQGRQPAWDVALVNTAPLATVRLRAGPAALATSLQRHIRHLSARRALLGSSLAKPEARRARRAQSADSRPRLVPLSAPSVAPASSALLWACPPACRA